MEQIWFYEYAVVFASDLLVTKFPQRSNCGFRSSGMRPCSIGPLDLSESGQYLRPKDRELVTKAQRRIPWDKNTIIWIERAWDAAE